MENKLAKKPDVDLLESLELKVGWVTATVRPVSHLRQSRTTLTCDKGPRVKVTSGTGHVARCVMARRTVARLVFGVERCSIL